MSKDVEFELNLAGLNELMKSPEMQAHLETASARVAELAGNGFGHRVGVASFTAIGNVFAENKEAPPRSATHSRGRLEMARPANCIYHGRKRDCLESVTG